MDKLASAIFPAVIQEEHLRLIRDFMVALAPEIAHHRLAQMRRTARAFDEDPNRFLQETAATSAKLTLEWAMHLAGQYVQCHDALHGRQTETDLIKAQLEKDAATEQETTRTTRPLSKTQARVPLGQPSVPDLPGPPSG